jgi:hypothetical protein
MRKIGLAITVDLYLHIDYKAAGAKIINYKLTSGELIPCQYEEVGYNE